MSKSYDLEPGLLMVRVLGVASDLVSEDGENPEYDRAIVELTMDLLGLDKDLHGATIRLLLGVSI